MSPGFVCIVIPDMNTICMGHNTRKKPRNMHEINLYGDSGIIVRTGIILNASTDLHIFPNATMNSDIYINEVHRSYVRLLKERCICRWSHLKLYLP